MKDLRSIRTLIVDDEPLARTAIRNMLRRHEGVEIVRECDGGAEAIAAIEELSPDIVFLDVQMPEVDGFMVLQALPQQNIPRIVFVTAYDQYAVRAFEVHALDYLLKPFDCERFDAALEHAMKHVAQGHEERIWNERLGAFLRLSRDKFLERVIVRSQGRVLLLPVKEVDWIEAEGNYVNLHGRGRTYLFREAIGSLEVSLDPRKFRRIHRSSIVNMDSVRELRPRFHGNYDVILVDGTELKLSHRYRANLEKDFRGSL
jgi:two-component system LytT family response regulator